MTDQGKSGRRRSCMETCEDCSDFRTTSTESYIGQNKFLEKIVEF